MRRPVLEMRKHEGKPTYAAAPYRPVGPSAHSHWPGSIILASSTNRLLGVYTWDVVTTNPSVENHPSRRRTVSVTSDTSDSVVMVLVGGLSISCGAPGPSPIPEGGAAPNTCPISSLKAAISSSSVPSRLPRRSSLHGALGRIQSKYLKRVGHGDLGSRPIHFSLQPMAIEYTLHADD